MPIMNGFEACERINDYLSENKNQFLSDRRAMPSRVLATRIFALTADISESMHNSILNS